MAESTTHSPAQPGVVLGLTFLLIGLTFALPFELVPEAQSGDFTPEIANVYACVAWAGWAHFLFAFRGQGSALARIRDEHKHGRRIAYVVCLLIAIIALVGVRSLSGAATFGAVVWVYFIDHFIKAEQSFEGMRTAGSTLVRWLSSYQPLLTFGWLSVVLMNVGEVNTYPWLLLGVSLALGALVLIFGGWKNLASGDVRGPLLSLFFVAEALVWGTYSRYGGPQFLTGVYVFHIAAGSYFHYLGSYFFANARSRSKDALISPLGILAVNIAIVAVGYVVAHQEALRWLTPILGIQWFTLWVAVHLVISDLFPLVKRWKLQGVQA